MKTPPRSMWDEERESLWLSLVYFVALFGSVLICHWFAGGFQ